MASELEEVDGEELVTGDPLTPKEELFCRAYGDPESDSFGKATKSADVAGYVQPHNAGWKLCRRPRIIARLAEYHKAASADLGRVMANLEHIRLLALAKEPQDLATAARCAELQGKRLARSLSGT